jgi:hypothetical protein
MRQMSGTAWRYQRTLVVIGSVAEADDVVQEVLRVHQILDAGAQITSPRVDVLTHCGPLADFTSLLKSARWLVPRKYLFENPANNCLLLSPRDWRCSERARCDSDALSRLAFVDGKRNATESMRLRE